MFMHMPVPAAQAVQALLQLATEQQKPSLHVPLAHATFVEQALPAVACVTQAPVLLQ
jgi:hypothetical protein